MAPSGMGSRMAGSPARWLRSWRRVTASLPAAANSATFKVTLPAGETTLQAQFIDDKGKAAGAFFVYVKYVGK